MKLAAVDPGVHRCAVAIFDGARLVDAAFFALPTFKRNSPTAVHPTAGLPKWIDGVIVEMPQYDGRARTARVQDLIGLAWHGALMAAALACGAPVFTATPAEWKGAEYKPQHHARLWQELTTEERRALGGNRTADVILAARRKGGLDRWSKPGGAYYPRSFDTHNLLDAAALGAWYLGRLPKGTEL